jgi:ribosomal protein L19E
MRKERKERKKGRGKKRGKKGEREDKKTFEKIKGMKTIRKKTLEVIYNLQPYNT